MAPILFVSALPVQGQNAARRISVCGHGCMGKRVAVPTRGTSMTAGEGMKSNSEKAKEFAKLYGGSYLGTSTAMAVVSYAIWYGLVSAGVDVVALIRSLGDWLATTPIGRPSALDSINETVGTATLAYIAHKASSPLRFPLTIAATPFVARAFAKKGEQPSDVQPTQAAKED